MQSNLGTADKIIRVLLAAIVAIAILTGNLTGQVAIAVGIVVGLLAITAFIGFCPIYATFGWSTKKKAA